jgi:nucleotide-binding universal stress UspA family protein
METRNAIRGPLPGRMGHTAGVSILVDLPPVDQPLAPMVARAHRILLAQDLSPGAEGSGRLAEALARRSDALLDVVVVVDGFSEIFLRKNRALAHDPERYLAAVQAALEVRVALSRARGVRCVGTLVVGAPSLELARHAAVTKADLIVLATSREVVLRVQTALHFRALVLGGPREGERPVGA